MDVFKTSVCHCAASHLHRGKVRKGGKGRERGKKKKRRKSNAKMRGSMTNL